MKIGILSMQRVENYGSLLQAYALKKTIELYDHDVCFVDIKYIRNDYDLLGNTKPSFIEYEKKGLTVSKIDKFLFYRFIHKFKNKYLLKEFDEFRRKYLNIGKTESNYDLCVIGSDEVFNCLNREFWGFTSQLFGNVPEAKKIITYAASCGSTTFHKIPDRVIERIENTIKNISGYSVRDSNTKMFLTNFIEDNITENIDPVLFYDFDKEIDCANEINCPKHYCIIYGYSNRFRNKNEYKAILSFCKKRGLTPISLFGHQFWCRKFMICSPFECLKLFKNADFVITDTFHGTIFSIKYSRKFAVIVRESNKNKLEDLVNRMQINNHIVANMNDLDKIYEIEKDEKAINDILTVEKEKTINYLERFIKQ